MKYTQPFIASLLTLALFLGGSGVVRAEEVVNVSATTSASVKAEIKDIQEAARTQINTIKTDTRNQIQEKRIDAKASIKANIEADQERRAEKRASTTEAFKERKAKLEEDAKRRIERHANKMIARTAAMIERVSKLTDRVESRVNKVAEKGIDVTEAKRFIASARGEITTATSTQAGLSASLALALQSENPKEALETTFKAGLESIKENLKNAHRALQNAVSSIKAGLQIRELNGNASTSAEVI